MLVGMRERCLQYRIPRVGREAGLASKLERLFDGSWLRAWNSGLRCVVRIEAAGRLVELRDGKARPPL